MTSPVRGSEAAASKVRQGFHG